MNCKMKEVKHKCKCVVRIGIKLKQENQQDPRYLDDIAHGQAPHDFVAIYILTKLIMTWAFC